MCAKNTNSLSRITEYSEYEPGQGLSEKWVPKRRHEVLKAKYKCLKKLFHMYDASLAQMLPAAAAVTRSEPDDAAPASEDKDGSAATSGPDPRPPRTLASDSLLHVTPTLNLARPSSMPDTQIKKSTTDFIQISHDTEKKTPSSSPYRFPNDVQCYRFRTKTHRTRFRINPKIRENSKNKPSHNKYNNWIFSCMASLRTRNSKIGSTGRGSPCERKNRICEAFERNSRINVCSTKRTRFECFMHRLLNCHSRKSSRPSWRQRVLLVPTNPECCSSQNCPSPCSYEPASEAVQSGAPPQYLPSLCPRRQITTQTSFMAPLQGQFPCERRQCPSKNGSCRRPSKYCLKQPRRDRSSSKFSLEGSHICVSRPSCGHPLMGNASNCLVHRLLNCETTVRQCQDSSPSALSAVRDPQVASFRGTPTCYPAATASTPSNSSCQGVVRHRFRSRKIRHKGCKDYIAVGTCTSPTGSLVVPTAKICLSSALDEKTPCADSPSCLVRARAVRTKQCMVQPPCGTTRATHCTPKVPRGTRRFSEKMCMPRFQACTGKRYDEDGGKCVAHPRCSPNAGRLQRCVPQEPADKPPWPYVRPPRSPPSSCSPSTCPPLLKAPPCGPATLPQSMCSPSPCPASPCPPPRCRPRFCPPPLCPPRQCPARTCPPRPCQPRPCPARSYPSPQNPQLWTCVTTGSDDNCYYESMLESVQRAREVCCADTTLQPCPFPECCSAFCGQIAYNDHLNSCHFPERSYKCFFCHKGFLTEAEKCRHENEHMYGSVRFADEVAAPQTYYSASDYSSSDSAGSAEGHPFAHNRFCAPDIIYCAGEKIHRNAFSKKGKAANAADGKTQTDLLLRKEDVPEDKLRKIVSFFDRIMGEPAMNNSRFSESNLRKSTTSEDNSKNHSDLDVCHCKSCINVLHTVECQTPAAARVQPACQLCGETFDHPAGLKLHLRVKHKRSPCGTEAEAGEPAARPLSAESDASNSVAGSPTSVEHLTPGGADAAAGDDSSDTLRQCDSGDELRAQSSTHEHSVNVVCYTSTETLSKKSAFASIFQKVKSRIYHYKWEPGTKIVRV